MIDFTKPVTTREGHKVRILCTDAPAVVGIIEGPEGEGILERWDLNGNYFIDKRSSVLDLINPPQKEVRYINIYPGETICGTHVTRETADNKACPSRIACLRIEFTSGQFDP